MAYVSKTPSMVLHELCVKRNMKETYEVVSMSGPPNDPVFIMSVETNTGLKATGMGKKKKEAQHNAAEALLAQINVPTDKEPVFTTGTILSPPTEFRTQAPVVTVPIQALPLSPSVQGSTSTSSLSDSLIEANAADNAVGRLQEHCMSLGVPLPVYSFIGRAGADHRPLFTMKCEVAHIFALGVSRTKQQGKQDAAKALYEKLVQFPHLLSSTNPERALQVLPTSPLTKEEKEEIIEKYALCKPLTDMPKTNPSLKFHSYHTSMEDLLRNVKDDLNENSFSTPVETLTSLAQKLNLVVSYHEANDILEFDTKKEKCYVYAIVNTQPTTVQIGEGKSTSSATVQAAFQVLQYWQTFLGIFPVM